MDIQTLQGLVRQFALARDWPRFHTPKNLAMALMVEAAELLEIFQWLTPDESEAVASDPAARQHLGEEVADVLIYLLQLANHTRLDLPAVVLDKLRRNARRYPPAAGAADVALPAADPDRPDIHVLLDYENVQPDEAELRRLVPQATKLWLFHGPHQKQLAERFPSFGNQLTVVPISRSGPDALDFHLSFYVGYLAARHPGARFVVLANDKGYEPMLEHVRQLDFDVRSQGVVRVAKPRRAAGAPRSRAAAPVRAPAAAPAAPAVPARQAVAMTAAKTAAAKTASRKRAPAKAAVAPAPAAPVATAKPVAAPRKKAAPAPVLAVPAKAAPRARKPAAKAASAQQRKLEADLHKLGAKRPVRLARLRGVLKSLLGPASSDDAVSATLDRLIARGIVSVDTGGAVSYPAPA